MHHRTFTVRADGDNFDVSTCSALISYTKLVSVHSTFCSNHHVVNNVYCADVAGVVGYDDNDVDDDDGDDDDVDDDDDDDVGDDESSGNDTGNGHDDANLETY